MLSNINTAVLYFIIWWEVTNSWDQSPMGPTTLPTPSVHGIRQQWLHVSRSTDILVETIICLSL